MTTLIDRITKRIDELKKSTCTKSIVDELERVKAELTAVNGVDELVEKRTKAEWVVAKSWYILVDEFISDLKSLKQTPVKDSQPKEVLLWEDTPYKEDLWCRIYGYVNDWKVNITRVEYTGTRGIG